MTFLILPTRCGSHTALTTVLQSFVASLVALLFGVGVTHPKAEAHSFRQRVGVYEDNEALSRRRFGLDMIFQGKEGLLGIKNASGYTFGLSVTRDQDRIQDVAQNDYVKDHYGSGNRVNDQWTFNMGQTWDKLTETRLVALGTDDGVVQTKTMGIGSSRWFFSESLRVSVDLSRTQSEQPEFKILDFDSREVGEPPSGMSQGATLSLRHLATPSTVVDYSFSQLTQRGRPVTRAGQLRVRQFLVDGPSSEGNPGESVKSSVDLGIARAVNKGPLGTDTSYGEVDSLTMDAAVNVNLAAQYQGRVAYRFYREAEETRVLREEKRFGSDLISIGLGYLFTKPLAQAAGLKGDVVVSRYQTNGGLAGRSLEAGLSALF